jgi:uncharacterized protein involved in response to NO
MPPPNLPGILSQARERIAQRLLMLYAVTGLFFMLLPGTFLGVWNLISISSQHRNAAISAAWIQAHGHAQMLGWIGTFILGIGFYSLPKMSGTASSSGRRALIVWACWTTGVGLRWSTGVYQWNWQTLLPLSALLELFAFVIFLVSSSTAHRAHQKSSTQMPFWIQAVLSGSVCLALALLLNLGAAIYVTKTGSGPSFPPALDIRLLALLCYGFIVPTIWGFSARWLPVFLGLIPINAKLLRYGLALVLLGVLAAQAGLFTVAAWLITVSACLSVFAFHLFARTEKSAKTQGVHPSFTVFIRLAYAWFLVATGLGIVAAYLDHANGWVGASRHALTVGFISTMVFAVGQRVLPAFGGMRVLYSPRLMLLCLLFLNIGCALRVSSEILAYEGYWPAAWHVLPWSAILELCAVTIFALNLVLTFRQPPAHEMRPLTAV